jgi:hypothetical protein
MLMKTEEPDRISPDVTGRLSKQPVESMQSIPEWMLDTSFLDLFNRPRAMPYRVKIGSAQIEADTAEEVFALLKRTEESGNGESVSVTAKRIEPEWTPDASLAFLKSLNAQIHQRQVMQVLLGVTNGITKEDLLAKIDRDAQQLGGTLSGIAKNAKKYCAEPVFELQRLQINGKRTCRYELTVGYRVAVVAAGAKWALTHQRSNEQKKEVATIGTAPVSSGIPNGGR